MLRRKATPGTVAARQLFRPRAGCGPGGRRPTPPAQPVAARSPPRRRAQTPKPTSRARSDALADLKAQGQEPVARQPGELGQGGRVLVFRYSGLQRDEPGGLRVGCELLDSEDIVTVQKLAGSAVGSGSARRLWRSFEGMSEGWFWQGKGQPPPSLVQGRCWRLGRRPAPRAQPRQGLCRCGLRL
jgi:hypothetical protein